VPHLLAAAVPFHDSNKTAFYIAAGVLVAWAVLISALGIRSPTFPTSRTQGRAAAAFTAVLVAVTAVLAVSTAKTPPHAPDYTTSAITNGTAPAFTPVSAAPPKSGPLTLAANPQGQLAYNTTSLVASSSHVTINFTNMSPLMHNVTIASASGKVLGATPTFTGGAKTLSLDLPPGRYTFYCSVPGHEQAGMKGTLIVR
jgi:plastocyanin